MSINKSLSVFVAALACCLILYACSDSPVLKPILEDEIILAFGDSLTVGVGTSEAYNYPSVLEEISNRKVVAAGVSGEETAQGLKRLPHVLDEFQPGSVILLEGGNDILRNRSMHNIKQNLAAMIEQIKSRNIDVVLIGVPEKKLFSDVAPLYQQLADEYGLVLADEVLSDLLRDNEYKSDAVHLNQQGYRKLAESIHKILVKYGAL